MECSTRLPSFRDQAEEATATLDWGKTDWLAVSDGLNCQWQIDPLAVSDTLTFSVRRTHCQC